MMGKPNQLEPKLFYHGISLDSRMPKGHPLRKIEQLVEFSFVRSKVHDLYGTRGNESVDPAVILKLMFLLFYENIKSERALMSQLPLRMDWLWFCGYDLDEKTPDHSVISKARRRWGLAVFSGFFENILTQCVDAEWPGENIKPRVHLPMRPITMASSGPVFEALEKYKFKT